MSTSAIAQLHIVNEFWQNLQFWGPTPTVAPMGVKFGVEQWTEDARQISPHVCNVSPRLCWTKNFKISPWVTEIPAYALHALEEASTHKSAHRNCDLDPKGFQDSSWNICMSSLVILASSVFEISWEKQTDKQTAVKTLLGDCRWRAWVIGKALYWICSRRFTRRHCWRRQLAVSLVIGDDVVVMMKRWWTLDGWLVSAARRPLILHATATAHNYKLSSDQSKKRQLTCNTKIAEGKINPQKTHISKACSRVKI